MAYIGKNLVGVLKEQKSVSTMTGDGSDTTLTLSDTPGSVNNVLVFFDGIRQQPITDYTLSGGTTVTFTTAPETGVIVTAIVGNHSGVDPKPNSITASKIADGSITGDNIPSITGSQLSGLASTKLTGTLPAMDGSALTGVVEHTQVTKSASDPTYTTNPSDGLGTIWCNTTTGNMYVCTDATTNLNEWINMGTGTGDIINFAPTNYTDSFPDLSESASTNYTFSGATDDGSVAHYLVEQISNPSLLAVTTAEMPNTQAHEFVTQSVDADTNVTFVVKTKDNLGKYSSGVTVTVAILNNVAPTNATNTASFADMNKNTSQNFTFSGATDTDGSVTHYMVDQISNAALTVTAAEVAAGSAHAFSAGGVSSDTAVTFRVRAKDNDGTYSTGVTVSMTVVNIVYTIATSTNSTNTNGIINGNYKYHVFNQSGSFNVSQVGNVESGVEYLVIAGGGGGAMYYNGGGGGAGGYRTGTGHTVSVQNYTITVGGGGATGAGRQNAASGTASVFSTINSTGGGYGSGDNSGNAGGAGGSGGGGAGGGGTQSAPAGKNAGGGTSGQGNNGGAGYNSMNAGGGGGGAGAVGVTSTTNAGGAGGAGLSSSITGSATVRAGGGGGSASHDSTSNGAGGNGGGGRGASMTSAALAGTANTGGGGGGGDHPPPYWGGFQDGKQGGSGIVIIRYKFQN